MDMQATPPVGAFPLVVITGLSGAGKSTALNVFEDLRFFTVDGLPASLALKLTDLFNSQNQPEYRGLAVGMDLRERDFDRKWRETLQGWRENGHACQILFIEADTDVLVRRYATTRRPHPLTEGGLGLERAIEEERALLEPMRREADLVVDTTTFSIHDLRRFLQEKWFFSESGQTGLRLHIVTFGFKYGMPSEADLVFDLRFLPNPYFDEKLRPLSGKDEPVASYVLGNPVGQGFMDRFLDFLRYILPLFEEEGRFRVTIAIGCTGGRHRSVAAAEAVCEALGKAGYSVSLEHRHLDLG